MCELSWKDYGDIRVVVVVLGEVDEVCIVDDGVFGVGVVFVYIVES